MPNPRPGDNLGAAEERGAKVRRKQDGGEGGCVEALSSKSEAR